MPPLRDNDRCRYLAVLEAAGRFTNLVLWKRTAADWVRENLGNQTQKGIVALMHQHRAEVEQREERRPEYRVDHPYWYRLVIPIGGSPIFIETILERGTTPEDDTVRVVSIHP